MSDARLIRILVRIYGVVITLFMLVAFVPKFIGMFMEEGFNFTDEFLKPLFNWYDNPTGFFITYLIGYIFLYIRLKVGAIIITAGGLLFWLINIANIGVLLFFVLPTVLVAVFYWFGMKRKE